jgi:hypothetical protein
MMAPQDGMAVPVVAIKDGRSFTKPARKGFKVCIPHGSKEMRLFIAGTDS